MALHEIFFNLKTPISKSMPLYSVAPSFSKISHLTPSSRENLFICPRQHLFEKLFFQQKEEETLISSFLQCYIKRIQAQQTGTLNEEKSYE